MKLWNGVLILILVIVMFFSSGCLNEIGQGVESGKEGWEGVKSTWQNVGSGDVFGKTVEAPNCSDAECYQSALSKAYKGSEVACASWLLQPVIAALAEKRIYLQFEEGVLDYCPVKKSESNVIGFCCYANECKKDGKNLNKDLQGTKGNVNAACREYDQSDCFKCSSKS